MSINNRLRYHVCAYKDCTNSRRNSSGLSFYVFPIKDIERCKKWISNCGNVRLLENIENLNFAKGKLLCEEHFTQDSFGDVRACPKRLTRSAIPLKCSSIDSNEDFLTVTRSVPLRTYSGVSSQMQEELSVNDQLENFLPTYPFPHPQSASSKSSTASENLSVKAFREAFKDDTSPNAAKSMPSFKIGHLRKKLLAKKAALWRLEIKYRRFFKKFTATQVLDNFLQYKTVEVRAFIKMQILHKNRSKWLNSEKKISLSIFYKSPSCYKFLRNIGFTLPCISTLRSWMRIFNLKAGVTTTLISNLEKKVSTMTDKEKECVILCDEIKLKQGLDYNRYFDFIEGFVDLGSIGREAKFADHGLVFYLRGLYNNWKIPFCYYVSAGPVKSTLLSKIIPEVIRKLIAIKLIPKVLVTDQGSNNRSAISTLGATKEAPFFFVDNVRIFVIFDPPHLLKSIRNNFSNNKLEFFVSGKKINWQDIVKTYETDKTGSSARSLVKITSKHIMPNAFEKMRVKYAAQIFSRSMSAAVLTAFGTGEVISVTAVDTALFTPYRKGLSIYKKLSQETLENAITYFKSFEVFENGKQRRNIYCIEGILWTINSTLLLWKELQSNHYSYLLTSRLNQDPLENCFSVLRNRGGYNPQPTVRQFRQALQQNMTIKLQDAIELANCEKDDHEFLELLSNESDSDENVEVETISAKTQVTQASSVVPSSDDSDEELAEKENISETPRTLESCAVYYVAGYLINYLFKKTGCEKCKTVLEDNSQSSVIDGKDLLVLNRDFGISETEVQFLRKPKNEFYKIVEILLKEFDIFFENKCTVDGFTRQLKFHLFKIISKIDNNPISRICEQRGILLIRQMIQIKLFRKLKWIVQQNTQKSRNLSYEKPINCTGTQKQKGGLFF